MPPERRVTFDAVDAHPENDIPIAELEVTVETRALLREVGIELIRDLKGKTVDELLCIPPVGSRSGRADPRCGRAKGIPARVGQVWAGRVCSHSNVVRGPRLPAVSQYRPVQP